MKSDLHKKKIQTDSESFKFLHDSKAKPTCPNRIWSTEPQGKDLQAEQNKMTSHDSKTSPSASLLNHYIELHVFFFFIYILLIAVMQQSCEISNKMQYRTYLWYTETVNLENTFLLLSLSFWGSSEAVLRLWSTALHCESQQTPLMLTLACFWAYFRSHNNVWIGF